MDYGDPVSDINPNHLGNVDDLVQALYGSGGFTAKKVGEGVNLMEEMIHDDYLIALSFPACITATGTRGVIKELVKRDLVDCIITTCGTIDHDVARVYRDYYHGSFLMDDVQLHKDGINRLGNILICQNTVSSWQITSTRLVKPMR